MDHYDNGLSNVTDDIISAGSVACQHKNTVLMVKNKLNPDLFFFFFFYILLTVHLDIIV